MIISDSGLLFGPPCKLVAVVKYQRERVKCQTPSKGHTMSVVFVRGVHHKGNEARCFIEI